MVKQLEFKGIVRATSAMNNADGNCEEVVNLRKENGVHRVVGKKKVLIKDVDYEQIYIHKSEDFENYIGIKSGKVICFASRVSGKIETKYQEICNTVGKVSINQVNNILLVKDDQCIHKALFQEIYNVELVDLPEVALVEIRCMEKDFSSTDKQNISFKVGDTTQESEAKKTIFSLITREKDNNPEYAEGRVFLVSAYELFDGSIVKTSTPIMVELGAYMNDVIKYENYTYGQTQTMEASLKNLQMAKLRVKVNNIVPDKFKEVVAKVHVYATPAYSFFADTVDLNIGGASRNIIISQKGIDKKDIEKMLFFKVASADANDPDNDFVDVELSEEVLATNETMPVDSSGWISTVGDMFVYNNRLHLHSLKRTFINDANFKYYVEGQYKTGASASRPGSEPVLSDKYDFSNARTLTAVVYIKTRNSEQRLKTQFRVELISTTASGAFTIYKIRYPKFFAYPDSRAYKVEFFDGNYFVRSANLCASNTYNFAFYKFDEKIQRLFGTQGEDKYIIEYSSENVKEQPNEYRNYTENQNLIVSESSNPYYFPPEHSYLMPGEIINLAVNTEQISASQVGMYPLYVFTTEGIYALQVGDGKVLYSNVIPISSEVAVKGSNVLQTKYGIAFVTESGLKLISGSEVVDLSEAVSGDVDKHVRNSPVFGKFEKIPLVLNPYYMLSRINFGEYIKGAVMGYDISKDELIISNSEYKYSYVYNLKVKEWHKITEVFTDFNRHLCITNKIHREATRACAVIRFSGIYKPNDWLAITIGSQRIEYTINSTRDYSGTVIPHIIEQIKGFVAERNDNSIFVYANETGACGNDIPMTLEFSGETSMTTDGFMGGKDEHDEGSIDVCDIREEVACVMPVYLQTRPISLDSFGFKKVLRMLFRGEFKPSELFYVTPMLASNDLVQWFTVGCVDTNKPKTFMEMKRAACSYRHFMILMSGTVESGHVISIVEIEGEETLNNRLR